jgi:hypothetical protein
MRALELPAKDCPHQTLETYGERHAVHHPSRTLPVDKISSYLWTQSCKQSSMQLKYTKLQTKFLHNLSTQFTNKISMLLQYAKVTNTNQT